MGTDTGEQVPAPAAGALLNDGQVVGDGGDGAGARAGSPRARRLAALAVGAAAAADVAAVAVLVAASIKGAAGPGALALASGLHLAAVAALALAPGVPRSRRWLLVALGLTMPVVGSLAAAFPLWGCGRGKLAEVMAVEDERPEAALEPRIIDAVADALAPFEALLVAGAEERRAMIWALGVRADREAIALLRWTLRAAPTEMGLEAALALEDIGNLFEKKLAALRARIEAAPTRATALEAAQQIAHAFDVGLLDPAQYHALVDEARRYFALAEAQDPAAAPEVAMGWSRLELAVLRPDLALEVLDRALPAAAPALGAEMRALREEAALRSHDVPWEGSSLLRTYRHALPVRPRPARAAPTAPPALRHEPGRPARRGLPPDGAGAPPAPPATAAVAAAGAPSLAPPPGPAGDGGAA
jgi:hypothetical protein